MSISNDHYYGFVNRFLVENQVTWLECAACSLIWTTMLVYYLEDPYGHLMNEPLGCPEARTKIRGNLFSFSMPWEDIESSCQQAEKHCKKVGHGFLRKAQKELGLPHSEGTLALLVNVHIVNGDKSLSEHLKGLTMRVAVLSRLIEILRASGYPGYEEKGINSSFRVSERLNERYIKKYGYASFTPEAVKEVVHIHKAKKNL